MFSQLLEIMFNLSDVAVVGQFADYKALGAVGSTTLLVTLFTSFLISMGSGVNVQVGVNSFDAIIVSGNSAAINADSIIFNVMAAFYTACASFIGQNRGARNKERMIKSYWISLLYFFSWTFTAVAEIIYFKVTFHKMMKKMEL